MADGGYPLAARRARETALSVYVECLHSDAGRRMVPIFLFEGYGSRRIDGRRRPRLGYRRCSPRSTVVMDVGGMCPGRVSAD
jgi:hypothetical protein